MILPLRNGLEDGSANQRIDCYPCVAVGRARVTDDRLQACDSDCLNTKRQVILALVMVAGFLKYYFIHVEVQRKERYNVLYLRKC